MLFIQTSKSPLEKIDCTKRTSLWYLWKLMTARLIFLKLFDHWWHCHRFSKSGWKQKLKKTVWKRFFAPYFWFLVNLVQSIFLGSLTCSNQQCSMRDCKLGGTLSRFQYSKLLGWENCRNCLFINRDANRTTYRRWFLPLVLYGYKNSLEYQWLTSRQSYGWWLIKIPDFFIWFQLDYFWLKAAVPMLTYFHLRKVSIKIDWLRTFCVG